MKNYFLLLSFLIALNFPLEAQTISIQTAVHVLYTEPSNDVSDALVLEYMEEVNKAFSKQSTPTFVRNSPIFDTLWADTEIQLCLATKDPSNYVTNGITHTHISSPVSMDDGSLPEVPIWDVNKHLNIYLVIGYPDPSYPNFIMSGISSTPLDHFPRYVPGSPTTPFYHVIVASNSIPFIPQLIAHEVGHVFGLDHVSDDELADTPEGIEFILSETGYSEVCTEELQNVNTTDLAEDGMHWGGVDPPDMVENFMGLTFCCAYMFTKDQKAVMHSLIETYLSGWITTECSSVNDLPDTHSSSTIELFPNPANEQLFVRTPTTNTPIPFLIQTIQGETLQVGILKETELLIDISNLAKGVYYLQLQNNPIQSLKFFKN